MFCLPNCGGNSSGFFQWLFFASVARVKKVGIPYIIHPSFIRDLFFVWVPKNVWSSSPPYPHISSENSYYLMFHLTCCMWGPDMDWNIDSHHSPTWTLPLWKDMLPFPQILRVAKSQDNKSLKPSDLVNYGYVGGSSRIYSLLFRRGNSSCKIHQHQGGFWIDISSLKSLSQTITYMKTMKNKPNVGNNYPTWMTWVLFLSWVLFFPHKMALIWSSPSLWIISGDIIGMWNKYITVLYVPCRLEKVDKWLR